VTAVTFLRVRLVDPASDRDEVTNVTIDGATIAAVGDQREGHEVDAEGLLLAPGLVDVHVHLREPGGEDAETVATGTGAAAAGGFTAVSPMANTDPVCDHAGVVEQVLRLAREAGSCDVFPVGAITKGLKGEELAEIGAMVAVGVRCFSDDGIPLRSAKVMRRALQYARTWDVAICNHAEDPDLIDGGHMHAGERSALLGVPGRPREAEEAMLARDLLLAARQGARLHVPHVSTAGGVALIRAAKARGVRVTAEVTPHHLVLTDAALTGYDPVFKVNPPLREDADVEALREGLADGTIDAIATDHAPHPVEQKEQELVQAPPGMVGLETSLAVIATELVAPGILTWSQAIAALSAKPARLRDIPGHGGPVAAGAPANLVLIDPAATWDVQAHRLVGRSHNTPFAGRTLRGRVERTILRGRTTYQRTPA
jgi:dihydroorotase